MSDPVLGVQKALIGFLRGQEMLGEWLGTPVRVYDLPPAEVRSPYVALGRVTVTPLGAAGGDVTEQVINLLCVSRFGGSEEAKTVAGLLRVLLDDVELVADGVHVVSVRVAFVDVFRSSDKRSWYAVVRVRVVSEEG